MNIFKKFVLFKNEVQSWLLFKKNCVKNSTYFRYKYLINQYLLPYFKEKSIYYFINYDFNIYINYLSKDLSPKTIKDIIVIFKSILKYIERKYNIDYKLDLIAIPKIKNVEVQVLSDIEKFKLEKYCLANNNLKNIGIIICLNTGLRLGEICGLTWNDINLQDSFIIINKTVQRIYKGKDNTLVQIDTPKTEKSIRKIPIPQKIIYVLKELKKQNKYHGEEYFLTGHERKYMEPRNYQRIFKNCCKKCGIQDYNFHVLRHTFATNCIKIGMDVKSLSELLGHSNVSITLNKYVHSSLNVQRKFLNKL